MIYPHTKLPKVGTTIFSVMSQMAAEHNAINLSQGFPDFDGPSALLEAVGRYIAQGANQYAPMTGVPALREQIAQKVALLYGREVSVDHEITVTSGATEALFAAIAAVVRADDEVIIFDPAYDSYEPAIELNGAKAVRLQLQAPDFRVNWDEVSAHITDKTRLIILNSPHNPTGTTLGADDLERLAELVEGTDILLLGDEVYEHIVFDNAPHHSLLTHAQLYERSFVVSSFGKTYHTTGWKVGYCVAPPALSVELRKVHQYLTFSTSTPMQLALADIMRDEPQHVSELPAFYQHKRDLFCDLIQPSRFKFTPTSGTYFQCVDYSAISDLPDVEFCKWLIEKAGVAAIPVSVFCEAPPDIRLVRFCFAKSDETLRAAAERICAI
ncbi:pyridoxal phosphate-dependent aminotransferase [Neptunomonas phycophila]|jgi:methionine aminotransferase|uniref:pyridoxal phosphate-dependent aminotransferase n=1 Tax=Neptunomonas phycophila TaxID=1572645 RepID=UPI001BE6EC6C|nr:pyridoxal phosphate-dependent aminotransferase [Neptunomonas phycophila]MBT3146822.1 pyridoxal phosphate-dependent aminotransferase [Neptunomonas phycophila]MDO6783719.1 pyridoxal phosphate-dependent aminotransferase [Neptunomonas phycophila]